MPVVTTERFVITDLEYPEKQNHVDEAAARAHGRRGARPPGAGGPGVEG